MVSIREHEDLSLYTSFHIGSKARFFASLASEADLLEAIGYAQDKKLPLHVLGGGSNTIFRETVEMIVGRMNISGIEIRSEDGKTAHVRISAGENWDQCVEFAVSHGLAGIEALSAIPGTAGATPVQNVGAYGAEIADELVELRAYDLVRKEFITLGKDECGFSYRRSRFNSSDRGRFAITSILLKLSKQPPKIPEYPGVAAYFAERGIEIPGLREIREAIREIRKTKLPDPSVVPNAGSFFKNPIITATQFKKLAQDFLLIPHFEVRENRVKIPAGWLIEQAGFKGKSIGPITVYEKNAVVLTNPRRARLEDLEAAKNEIIETVGKKFGIRLEQEPEMV